MLPLLFQTHVKQQKYLGSSSYLLCPCGEKCRVCIFCYEKKRNCMLRHFEITVNFLLYTVQSPAAFSRKVCALQMQIVIEHHCKKALMNSLAKYFKN